MSRRDHQIVGMAALMAAWIWQLFVNIVGIGLGLANTGHADDLRWVSLLQFAGFLLFPIGYAACIRGSRRSLRFAAVVVVLTTAAAFASGFAYEMAWTEHVDWTGPVWSWFFGAVGGALLLDVPALLLLVGIWRMRRFNEPRANAATSRGTR